MDKKVIIKVNNLDFLYERDEEKQDKDIRDLKDINLDIYDGEFICIVGKNGSGKSTLAKMFNALLLPSNGNVEVLGLDTRDEKSTLDIRKSVAMVFQNPDNQIVASLVEEDVAFGLENLGVPTEELQKKVNESIAIMGLTEYKDKSPSRLSGGQKQRVALAGIIAMKPRVIILDEPTSMLDPKARKDLINIIIDLNKNEHITIILITHYMDELLYSDRVVVMEEGKIKHITTKDHILNDLNIDDMGLELPSILKIKRDLKEKGIFIPDDVYTAEEMIKYI